VGQFSADLTLYDSAFYKASALVIMKMKKILIYFMLVFGNLTACCQQPINQSDNSVSFDTIIKHVRKQPIWFAPPQDSIELPVIYKANAYQIEISNNPIPFDMKEIVLKNPYNDHFPISFSVVYQNRIVSLFKPGKFVCHVIPNMKRDITFEKVLNTKQFQYHWLIGDKLVGYSKGEYYYLNSDNKWVAYKNSTPIKNQPKLFEDETYLAFCDCHGEWGGTVYFYNKTSQKVFFTEATCANTIFKEGDKYFVLSQLGHMSGSSELKEIDSPDALSQTELENINKSFRGQALGYSDNSGAAKKVFDYYGIQIFSAFTYQDRRIYLINWNEETFLAEIENNAIKIINPLFNREIYSHNPITTLYGNTILINLDFYFGYYRNDDENSKFIEEQRERSCILINDNQLIKLDWNEKY
jgi:hypothetical protein